MYYLTYVTLFILLLLILKETDRSLHVSYELRPLQPKK